MKSISSLIGALALLAMTHTVLVTAQTNPEKIYWMQTITVPLPNLQRFHAYTAQEVLPFLRQNGYPVVGVWQTVIGEIEEVLIIAEFDSMDAYHQARQSLFASEEWQNIGAEMIEVARGTRTRMFVAMPYVD